jgi:flagellin
MPITIASNIASLGAQRQLTKASESVGTIYERLSSGMRINKASDDAAGLAIADSLRSDARVFSKGISNANDTISALSIADGALTLLSEIITRQNELAAQAANGVYSLNQRKALNQEAKALTDEFNRIVSTTTFNGTKLLEGNDNNLRTQVGFGIEGSILSKFAEELKRTVGTGTFSAFTTQSMVLPVDLRLADWNNDGTLDLVGIFGNDVGIAYGNGDGSFANAITYESYAGSNRIGFSMAFGDLNGDGIQDAFVAGNDFSAGNVSYFSVLYGNSNGTFNAPIISVNSDTNRYKDSILTDFNGDGRADLIAVSESSSELIFFTNNGAGGFTATMSLATPGSPDELFYEDLDNDGDRDILVAGSAGNLVLKNNGNNTFSSFQTFSGVGDTNSIELVDINNDGIKDLISSGSGSNVINVHIGNGDGSFKSTTTYAASATTEGLVAGDLNGDGIIDLIGQTTGSFMNVFLGKGDGTFNSAISVARNTGSAGLIVLGDLNKDGATDLVTSVPGPNQIGIALGVSREVSFTKYLDLFSVQSARESLDYTQSILSNIANTRGAIGASLTRLEVAKNTLFNFRQNYNSAESLIRDTDVAEDAAKLAAQKILQQSASKILSLANLVPELSLNLLRN